MSAQAREFINFWIQNSVHAADPSNAPGGSQDVGQLAEHCVEMAKALGIPEEAMRDEVGDVAEYISGKLNSANQAEPDRLK